ncbi:MAG: copper amine oxidase N-terminal domain-containing protein [Defluviitaleaceae bacterium]|nr:copper amine oxidase N-terminal domain-containing protein [Defluviitaleaceae bacterium]MCL2263998.1 copper amine oxidase N-terminal domain-containing protein [Defluviitaleaceae bacterium]
MKRVAGIFTVLVFAFILSSFTLNAAEVTAVPSSHPVFVDNEPVPFRAFNIGGSNFFMLRDIAYTLNGTSSQFDVTWDGERGAINLLTGQSYTVLGGEMASGDGVAATATPSAAAVYSNGVPVNLRAYNIGGNNFFMLRDLGEALGFEVLWDETLRAVIIVTGYAAAYEYVPASQPSPEIITPPVVVPGGDRLVWVPRTRNNIYHSINDCGRMNPNFATSYTHTELHARGYRACDRCW